MSKPNKIVTPTSVPGILPRPPMMTAQRIATDRLNPKAFGSPVVPMLATDRQPASPAIAAAMVKAESRTFATEIPIVAAVRGSSRTATHALPSVDFSRIVHLHIKKLAKRCILIIYCKKFGILHQLSECATCFILLQTQSIDNS